LPTGTDTINADYSGDTTFYPSSGSIAVTVNAPTPGVTFSANPNPIISATGMGMTTLSWNAPGYNQLVITVGSVTGTPLTGTVGSSGAAQTGSSVTDGLQFFLVDLTSHSSIASVTVHVVLPTLLPVLTSISPSATEVGSQSLKLQAIGSNFATASVVRWGGTKLATQFQNSGSLLATVPASLLTADITIQVQVDTNGQVSAPLPFVVGDTPWLVNSMMTKSLNTSGCQVPTAATSFLYSDPGATVWFSVDGTVAGDIVEADWYDPAGNHFGNTVFWNPLPSGGSWCFWKTLDISGDRPPNLPGDWKAVITWNGTRFFTLPFTIEPIPAGAFDGQWSGTNLSMTVTGGNVTAFTYGGPVLLPHGTSIPIEGNSFRGCEAPVLLTGVFQSSTQASGWLWGGMVVGCSIGSGSPVAWTATKH
jgi:hypothetical protein